MVTNSFDNVKTEGLCFPSSVKTFLLCFLPLGVPPFPFSTLPHLGAPAGILFFHFSTYTLTCCTCFLVSLLNKTVLKEES